MAGKRASEEEAAAALALRALAFLLADDDRRQTFMVQSGFAPQDLAGLVTDTAALGSVLDIILADDATILAFCGAAELTPEDVVRAGHVLAPVRHD